MPDEAEKPTAEADAAPPAASSRKRLPMILSAVVLLGGGAAAAWYLGVLPIGGGKRHADATASIEKAHEEGAAAEGEHGGEGHTEGAKQGNSATLPLDTFIANLADDGGKRYLKTTILVEFLGDAVPPGINAHLPQIRDLLLTLLTSKTFAEIRTPEGKQGLREEIIARLNQALDRDAVKAVYFTEFIVQ